MIFYQLERGDQISCALVCQTWSEVALDIIWYEVDDVRVLANLFTLITTSEPEETCNTCVELFVY